MMAPARSSTLRRVGALLFGLAGIAQVQALSVANTVLVFARDPTTATSATSGLDGYGIPYQVVSVPSTGITLPALNSTSSQGNYGAIVVIGEVSYDYNGVYNSALTNAQWQTLFDYQTAFGVRMVRLDVYPNENDFGTTALGGTSSDQPLSFSNTSAFASAGLKTGSTAAMSTAGLYHYPAKITNSSMAWEIAQFAPVDTFPLSTAAVINKIGNRQQMAWFLPFATDWSATSTFVQHAWITWATRGLYNGQRRIYFSTQIDDVFLSTDLYYPVNTTYRITPADLTSHKNWSANLRKRMNKDSNYTIELGYNGNGVIETGVNKEQNLATKSQKCSPATAIEYNDQVDTPLEFQKLKLNTGINIWPKTPTSYIWSADCAKIDPLMQWFLDTTNRDSFMHISHTFSHASLNNATFLDVSKEITFNQAWMKQVGLSAAPFFSVNGLIPPAITGLHNGDAIRAWMTNGIKYVVGDNTRTPLRNPNSPFWPLTSTVDDNGWAGLTIMPRWATNVYYNCDTADCTTREWIKTAAGKGVFSDLLADAKSTSMRNLLGLHQDSYMFHQANLRSTAEVFPIAGFNTQTGNKASLLQIWVETVVGEFNRLVNWPMLTLKHDDLAKTFIARQTRDGCNPKLSFTYSADGKSITAATLTTTNNRCSTPIPITVPSDVKSLNGGSKEQFGNDPLTIWATMNGVAQTFTFNTPIPV